MEAMVTGARGSVEVLGRVLPRRRRERMRAEPATLERLSSLGSAALSSEELLEVLLDGRRAGAWREALARAGSLAALRSLSLLDLLHHGFDARQAAKLRAVVELAARFSRFEVASQPGHLDRQRVTAYLTLRYHRTDQEIFGALFFDGRQRLLSERELFRGTSSRCLVDKRLILREALCLGAEKMILFHTHPNGSPDPSTDDIVITRALRLAAQTVGLDLLDHLVLSGDGQVMVVEV